MAAASNSLRWVAAWALCAGLAAGQTHAPPVVPTDHYGPPVCWNARPAGPRETPEMAQAEQQLGADDPGALLAAEPLENFDIARARVGAYADCVGNGGCYWADLDAQYKRAEEALAREIAAPKHAEKLAIVFDIDETSLTNYCEMKREAWGYIPSLRDPWTLSGEAATAIPGALRLYRKARNARVAVFFITGRPGAPDPDNPRSAADQTAVTAASLKAAGFDGWNGLALRNGAENRMGTVEYKSTERKKIVDQQYRIVMSVGDQWSDLMGEPKADVSVKLPNPFYFLPSKNP